MGWSSLGNPPRVFFRTAAPGREGGCSEPILKGLAGPNGARQGSGKSIMAPIAPPPQPTSRRRVSLPRYQMSCAHFSSFHFLVIGCSYLLEFVLSGFHPSGIRPIVP